MIVCSISILFKFPSCKINPSANSRKKFLQSNLMPYRLFDCIRGGDTRKFHCERPKVISECIQMYSILPVILHKYQIIPSSIQAMSYQAMYSAESKVRHLCM